MPNSTLFFNYSEGNAALLNPQQAPAGVIATVWNAIVGGMDSFLRNNADLNDSRFDGLTALNNVYALNVDDAFVQAITNVNVTTLDLSDLGQNIMMEAVFAVENIVDAGNAPSFISARIPSRPTATIQAEVSGSVIDPQFYNSGNQAAISAEVFPMKLQIQQDCNDVLVGIGSYNATSQAVNTGVIAILGGQNEEILTATRQSNLLRGDSDALETLYFPSQSGESFVVDAAANARIAFTTPDGASLLLRGNALPLTDDIGVPLPGQWELEGFRLTTINGVDLKIEGNGIEVTIKNFPFDQNVGNNF